VDNELQRFRPPRQGLAGCGGNGESGDASRNEKYHQRLEEGEKRDMGNEKGLVKWNRCDSGTRESGRSHLPNRYASTL
jgi:hypothetical protein